MTTAAEATAFLEQGPVLGVVANEHLPDGSGLELLCATRGTWRFALLFSARNDLCIANAAQREGVEFAFADPCGRGPSEGSPELAQSVAAFVARSVVATPGAQLDAIAQRIASLARLTPAERSALRAMLEADGHADVAAAIGRCQKTADKHIERVQRKLGEARETVRLCPDGKMATLRARSLEDLLWDAHGIARALRGRPPR